MKARVKQTGEIVELHPYDEVYEKQKEPYKSKKHKICHLEGIEIFDEHDYWEKLKHQYAGMAMQGLISNSVFFKEVDHVTNGKPENLIAAFAINISTALVEKLKEKSKC